MDCKEFQEVATQQSCIDYLSQQDVLGLGLLGLMFLLIALVVITAIIRTT